MGYGPEQGYSFLIEEIIKNDYRPLGIELSTDEVFISDAAKCDTANIQEIFGLDNIIAVTDPVYPVYVDSNVMAGRSGPMQDNGRYQGIVYLPCTAENNFIPELPETPVDLIYLCLPNNPTGTALTREELSKWVEYARENNSIILFDAAYEAYVTEDNIPRSIYEIEGAKEVAIEFRSFSKNAGFTGTRCAFSVVPKEIKAFDLDGNAHDLNSLWNRRQTTKFNGVSYPVQRAAKAVYSPEGQKEIKESIAYYLNNASIVRKSMKDIGLNVYVRPLGEACVSASYEVGNGGEVIMDAQQLYARLASPMPLLDARRSQVPVTIRARSDVRWQFVLEAYNQASRAKFQKISIHRES